MPDARSAPAVWPLLVDVTATRSGDSVVTWILISGWRRATLAGVVAGDTDGDVPRTTAASDRSIPPSTAPANVDCPASLTLSAAEV